MESFVSIDDVVTAMMHDRAVGRRRSLCSANAARIPQRRVFSCRWAASERKLLEKYNTTAVTQITNMNAHLFFAFTSASADTSSLQAAV
jgi:hypothetical protein